MTLKIPAETVTASTYAEESLLGAILLEACSGNKTVVDEVKKIVSVDDFLDYGFPAAQLSRIYEAMLHCQQPDVIGVASQLDKEGKLRPGDCSYLMHLTAIVPMSLDFAHYAETVKDYSVKRRTMPGSESKKVKKVFRGF